MGNQKSSFVSCSLCCLESRLEDMQKKKRHIVCFNWLNQHYWNNQSTSGCYACLCILGIFVYFCLKYHTAHFEPAFVQVWTVNPYHTHQVKESHYRVVLSSLKLSYSTDSLFLSSQSGSQNWLFENLSTMFFSCHKVPNNISVTYDKQCY